MQAWSRVCAAASPGAGAGSQQGFKVQRAQPAIGQNHDRRVRRDELGGGSDQDFIKRLSVFVAGLQRILQVKQSLAVTLDARHNLRLRGELNQRNLSWRDDPQVRLLASQPVEEQRCAGLPGDLAGIQSCGLEGGFVPGHAQALRQHPSAALVSHGQSHFALAFFHQQLNVVVVDADGVGCEGKPRVLVLELRPRRFEGGQRGFVHLLRCLGVAFMLK